MKNSVLCYLEETAARLPDKVAFFDAEGEITFEQLRKSAVDIAFAIQENALLSVCKNSHCTKSP